MRSTMKNKVTIILLFILILPFLIGCKKIDSDINNINLQIEEIEINNNYQESIIKIMKLKNVINDLTEQQKRQVKINKLEKLSEIVTNKLKRQVEWSEYLSKDLEYVNYYDKYNLSYIHKITVYDYIATSTWFDIKNEQYFDSVKEYLNLPYCKATNYLKIVQILRDKYGYDVHNEKQLQIFYGDKDNNNNCIFYFFYSYIIFLKEENNEVCEYISLIPLSEEQLNNITNTQILHEKGYY